MIYIEESKKHEASVGEDIEVTFKNTKKGVASIQLLFYVY